MPLRSATSSKRRARYPNRRQIPSPTLPAGLPRKGHPIAPWLKYGCPVGCIQRAHPHQKIGAGAPERGARAAEEKFALSPAGGAEHPSAQLLARPISRAAGLGGWGGESFTARSPLVQSTTCLGLHLVTGSMVSCFAALGLGSRRRSPEACARGCPLCVPGVRSSLHGRSQPAIAQRLREGSAALGPCAPDSCIRYGCSPQPPPSSCGSPHAAR